MIHKSQVIAGPQIHQFNNIAPQKIPRSAFQRDFTRRTTFDENYLVPIFLDEILPGDDARVKMTSFARLATPIKPIMDNLYLETFWFFIPNRLLWTNWEKFQGMQTNPGDSVAYTIPVLNNAVAPMSTTGFVEQSVYDYLGLPIKKTGLDTISALPNRAIDRIWNEWFRDEDLQNSLTLQTGDGPDDPALYELRKRNKRKDYFTSARPWPQKGTAITLSLGSTAPLIGAGNLSIPSTGHSLAIRGANNGNPSTIVTDSDTGATITNPAQNIAFSTIAAGLTADLASATGPSINAIRQSSLYQQILELDARSGTRYVESLFSRFGVVSPDFRLQRPELIGQGSSRINIYAVPQTAATGATGTPQGNLAAFGTNLITDHGFHYSATEHGMILGFANIRADLTYQQAVPKMFLRQTRLDFYEPLLNGLGEQAITNAEIWADGTANDQAVFGYQERFSEYRFKNSEITGLFRSDATGTLDVWHLSQDFASLPALNSTFITENVPMDRVVAVPSEPTFLMDCHFKYTHVRPMPIRSNPGINRL